MAKEKENNPNNEEEPTGLAGRIVQWIGSFFKEQFRQVWDSLETRMHTLAASAVKGVLHALSLNPAPIFKELTDEMVAFKMISARDAAVLMKHAEKWQNMGWFVYALNIIGIFFRRMIVSTDMILADEMQQLASQLEPALPDVQTLVKAAFIAPEKTGEVRDALKRQGLSDEFIDLIFVASYRLYDVGEIRELFFRGVIDEAKVYERMAELGFTETRIKEIVQAWEILPSMQDIVRYLAKEVFEPQMIETFGLMEDYPSEAEIWGQKLGVSPRWVKAEWVAHWMPPPLTTILEGFQRGFMEWDEVELYMRLVEIPPRFRELVRDMAYSPYTRVDIRRMHAMGVLDDQQTYQAYRDIGYNHERALNLLKWTKLYNTQSDRNLTMSQILKAYKLKALTAAQTESLLTDIGYTEEKAQFQIRLQDLTAENEYTEALIKNIGERYTANLIDKRQTVERLNRLNIPDKQVQLLLDQWELDIYQDKAHHSKTDLGKMYIEKIIDADRYRLEMGRIGYSFEQISNYLKLMDKTKKPI